MDVSSSNLTSQQLFVLMKASWGRLSSLSSEDVFKTSSRRLDQYQYICLTHTSSRRLDQDQYNVLVIRLQDVFKTFPSCL